MAYQLQKKVPKKIDLSEMDDACDIDEDKLDRILQTIKDSSHTTASLERLTEIRDTVDDIYEYISGIGNLVYFALFCAVAWKFLSISIP